MIPFLRLLRSSGIGKCVFCLVIIFNLLTPSWSQTYKTLDSLNGHKAQTFFSKGAEKKAIRMATQLDSVMDFYDRHLHFTPAVTLLILSPQDWKLYTQFPFYGMPHYSSNKTLIVASDDNDYWKSMIPAKDKIPAEMAAAIRKAYSNQQGELSMEAFFDLLAIHELGHAYHNQASLKMQRRWMGELFSNILLHTYIAEKEPALLPALTLFPNMVVATTDTSTLKFTTLDELEKNYNIMGPQYPENYGWYQCRWHKEAGKIYDAGGISLVQRLWKMLQSNKEMVNDHILVQQMNEVHPVLADVFLKWDN